MGTLSKTRSRARLLLQMNENDPVRKFNQVALMYRLKRLGLLAPDENSLDAILGLKVEDFLERRLQHRLVQVLIAKSVHHSRVLIKQRHIKVGKQLVNCAGMFVRADNDNYIDFADNSSLGGGRPGRRKRKKMKMGGGADADEGE